MLGPRPLPRLDLDDGVPTELRTLVVVPMLLTSEADVEAQVGGLEVHYLGNREGDLRFALLSDWLDAPTEQVPGDDELLSAAAAAIDRLNERHGEAPGGGARFLLFHRRATLERGRGLLDGLGAQARQAPRAERPPARLDDDRHPDDRAGRVDPADGRALRGHARRRHAAAPGRGRAPGRDDRPSAQPADLRSRVPAG